MFSYGYALECAVESWCSCSMSRAYGKVKKTKSLINNGSHGWKAMKLTAIYQIVCSYIIMLCINQCMFPTAILKINIILLNHVKNYIFRVYNSILIICSSTEQRWTKSLVFFYFWKNHTAPSLLVTSRSKTNRG